MDRNLNSLCKARETYSKLIIEIGCEYLRKFPHACPEELLDSVMPPRDELLAIFKMEKARLKKKNRLRELKLQRKMSQSLGWFNCG